MRAVRRMLLLQPILRTLFLFPLFNYIYVKLKGKQKPADVCGDGRAAPRRAEREQQFATAIVK